MGLPQGPPARTSYQGDSSVATLKQPQKGETESHGQGPCMKSNTVYIRAVGCTDKAENLKLDRVELLEPKSS